MKVLLLTSFYPDEDNPYAGIFFKDQARALSLQHYVIVASVSVDYNKFRWRSGYYIKKNKVNNNLTEFIIKIYRHLPYINQLNYLYRAYKAIRKIVKTEKIDIVHAHFAYPAAYLASLLKKNLHTPYIVTEHSSDFNKGLRTIFHKKLAIKGLQEANKVYASGDYLAKFLSINYGITTGILYNGIDIKRFKLRRKRELSDPVRIGFLGTLNELRKGLHILLQALVKIDSFNYQLNVGGEGENKVYFKQMAVDLGIADKCFFYGAILPEKMPDFMFQNDIFILPSLAESFGVVVIEAMASGLPVIATKCGGPEFIVTRETGIIVEKNNAIALMEAILQLYRNYHLYDPYIIRKYVDGKFSYETLLSNLTHAYNNVINKR